MVIYIFDIDGTIADLSHRLHFIQNKPAKWKEFFLACKDDTPIEDVVLVLKALEAGGSRIILVTGRSDIARRETIEWFIDFGIPFDELYMRKDGDHREDYIVKSELLDKVLGNHPGREIDAVFEDRQQVVDMYRSRGLRV